MSKQRNQPGRVWRRRFIFIWVLLIFATATLVGWLSLRSVERSMAAELEQRLEVEAVRLEANLEGLSNQFQEDVERFSQVALLMGGGRLIAARQPQEDLNATMASTLEPWAKFLEIDTWELLEHESTDADQALNAPPIEPFGPRKVIRSLGLGFEMQTTLLADRVSLHCYRSLDEASMSPHNPDLAIAWFANEAQTILRTNSAGSNFDSVKVRRWLEQEGVSLQTVQANAGAFWISRRVVLQPGTFWIAIPQQRFELALQAAKREVAIGVVLLSLFAAIVAWVIGRLMTRPLDQFIHRLNRTLTGDADYGSLPMQKDEFGSMEGWVSDLKRQLNKEKQKTRVAEREAAWREVARQVAHDVKNPLAPIRLTMENLERVRRRNPEQLSTQFKEEAPLVLEEVARLQRLVESFAAFAELPAPRLQPVRLRSVLDPIVRLMRDESTIQLHWEPCSNDLEILADPDLLTQVVQNLVLNGKEAVTDQQDGSVAIRVEPLEQTVDIVIEDNGPGFSEEILQRSGVAIKSSKGTGRGQGLAIARRLTENQGGSITFDNRPAGGARVRLSFPYE